MTEVDIDKRIRLTHILGALIFEFIAMKDKPTHKHHVHDNDETSLSEDAEEPEEPKEPDSLTSEEKAKII